MFDLMLYTAKENRTADVRFCFELISPQDKKVFQCESAVRHRLWHSF